MKLKKKQRKKHNRNEDNYEVSQRQMLCIWKCEDETKKRHREK